MKYLPVQIALVAFLFLCGCGCDRGPKPTYKSSRRILALYVRPSTPPPSLFKYILDTNDTDVFQGQLGDFNGNITARSVSSNSAAWRLQLRIEGAMKSGAPVSMTTLLDVTYPRPQEVVIAGGKITGWFLSDEELRDFDTRMSQ
jgi:hypothetical protein